MPTCRKGKRGSAKGNMTGSSKKRSSKKGSKKKSSKYTECDSSSSSSDDGDEEEEEESTTVATDLLDANLSSSAGCVSVTALASVSFIVTVFFAY
jgi:hypothetical protein